MNPATSSPTLKLLKLRHVMTMTSLARSTIYRYCSDNNFPKPVKLGKRNIAWIEGEVQEWIEQKAHQRDISSPIMGC
ncbi:helix-turn-helix transcriptional regulator [Neptuniibacter halophilus]|uniref:helix-turn-helix transcriptional regulator n=1 Tax=Neptuniibacter halophilus TaxID=651666 RepID=UPI0025724931|nr:AlpA family transcriptional regulator [Neptuniibacter halophilus]